MVMSPFFAEENVYVSIYMVCLNAPDELLSVSIVMTANKGSVASMMTSGVDYSADEFRKSCRDRLYDPIYLSHELCDVFLKQNGAYDN